MFSTSGSSSSIDAGLFSGSLTNREANFTTKLAKRCGFNARNVALLLDIPSGGGGGGGMTSVQVQTLIDASTADLLDTDDVNYQIDLSLNAMRVEYVKQMNVASFLDGSTKMGVEAILQSLVLINERAYQGIHDASDAWDKGNAAQESADYANSRITGLITSGGTLFQLVLRVGALELLTSSNNLAVREEIKDVDERCDDIEDNLGNHWNHITDAEDNIITHWNNIMDLWTAVNALNSPTSNDLNLITRTLEDLTTVTGVVAIQSWFDWSYNNILGQGARINVLEGSNLGHNINIANLQSMVSQIVGYIYPSNIWGLGDSLKTYITAIEVRSTNIETVNTTQTTDITALQTRATAIETVNTTQTTDITALQTRATAIETVNTTQTTDITALQTRATAIETVNTTQNTRLGLIEAGVYVTAAAMNAAIAAAITAYQARFPYFQTVITPSAAGQVFTIAHNLGVPHSMLSFEVKYEVTTAVNGFSVGQILTLDDVASDVSGNGKTYGCVFCSIDSNNIRLILGSYGVSLIRYTGGVVDNIVLMLYTHVKLNVTIQKSAWAGTT